MKHLVGLVAVVIVGACSSAAPPAVMRAPAPIVAAPPPAPIVAPAPPRALPLERIAIIGASVSAGFGGTPFGDAFTAAAPHSIVDSAADVMMFRDPIGNTTKQIDHAIAAHATTIIALDFLFWDVYGSTLPAWRERALTHALAELERARATGAWIVVGDIPLITTAAEWMLPHDQVPAPADLDALNAQLAAWAAGRERVLAIPLAAWTAPLRAGGDIDGTAPPFGGAAGQGPAPTVELAPGERVPASSLVALDGLHANALGTWYLLAKLDQLIEAKLPGTPHDALVFTRPAP